MATNFAISIKKENVDGKIDISSLICNQSKSDESNDRIMVAGPADGKYYIVYSNLNSPYSREEISNYIRKNRIGCVIQDLKTAEIPEYIKEMYQRYCQNFCKG